MEHGELETILEMPYDYIIEMICDWWSFSWQSGNLYEIFKWYEMCIRDRSNSVIVTSNLFTDLLSKLCKLFPVSYTHLDVYKRQWLT